MISVDAKYLVRLGTVFLVIISQIYFPIIHVGAIQIQPDIVLLYITVLAILYGRLLSIIMGFFLGLIQDFSTQVELLGILSLSKSIAAYIIGSIYNYKTIWSQKTQYIVLLGAYFIHFFIYFYLFSRSIFDWYYLFIFILIHSVIVFLFFILFNNLIYKNKLLQ